MTRTVKPPAGGYCLVPATALLRAWWAYRGGELRWVDLRVWLATFEAVARRCGLREGRLARYSAEELAELGHASVRTARSAVGRLGRAGYLSWSSHHLRPTAPETEPDPDTAERLDLVVHRRRLLPVPRRLLRYLAGNGTPATVATALGVLLRCVYRRGDAVTREGLVKASWVAEVFGIDVRNVKRARAALAASGWLRVGTAHQRVLNRHGAPVAVDVGWAPRRTGTPPLRGRRSTATPPPKKNGNSLPGSGTRNRPAGGDGRRERGRGGLGRVVEADLRSLPRLRAVFGRAVDAGLVRPCESDALNVAAAAAHALRVGTRNAAGLFASIVRGRRWELLTHADEDRARPVAGSLVALQRPPAPRAASTAAVSMRPEEVRLLVRRSLASVGEG